MSNDGEPVLTRRALRELRRAQEEARRASDASVPTGGQQEDADGAASPSVASGGQPSPVASDTDPQSDVPGPTTPPASTPRTTPAAGARGSTPAAAPADAADEAPSSAETGQRSTNGRGKRAAAPQGATAAPSSATEDETTSERVQRANRSRRAAEAPVDAVPAGPGRTERSSLQRARDREALRRRRAAEEASAQPPSTDEAAPLTRRQLRLQALAAAKAASGREAAPTGGQAPAAASAEEAAHLDTAPNPVAGPGQQNEPAGVGEAKTEPKTDAEMSVEEALRARRAARPPKATTAPGGAGRAVQRERPRSAPASASGAGSGAASASAASEDTGLVDLETLATQRERAARAAIINRRIAERRRLEAETAQRLNQVSADPFTGAMNQFIDPEAEKRLVNTGIAGPPTSGVELDLRAAAAHDGGSDGVRRSAKPIPHGGATADQLRQTAERRGAPGDSTGDHDRPAGDSEAAAQPLAATSAQGLDPLDSVTAGIRRANQWFYVSFGALAVGVGTFAAGIIMIVNSN